MRVLPWIISILACLPFLMDACSPLVSSPEGCSPTGFDQYDAPYYVANGRAVFERGNGIAGPNPYDPDPNAPAIYFHWFTWLLGFLVVLGFEPGFTYLAIGVLAACVCARLTFALVEEIAPRNRIPLFFVAMWGGGLAVATHTLSSLLSGDPLLHDVFEFEPMFGWPLSWGRNLGTATQAIYHTLAAGFLLAMVRGRWRAAIVWLALVAATHPFTGVELLLTASFCGVLYRTYPQAKARPSATVLFAIALIGSAFVAYYGIFLPSFEQHRTIAAGWKLEWQESVVETVVGYGGVALFASIAILRKKTPIFRATLLFAALFIVAFSLSHHHWIMASSQPLHFTHGFVWLPLFLLAAPWLAEAISARKLWVMVLLVLMLIDNLVWVSDRAFHWQESNVVRCMDEEVREIFEFMDDENLEGVLISSSPAVSYLAATYTRARPYLGHYYLTPDLERRRSEMEAYFRDGLVGEWHEHVTLAIVRPHTKMPGWRILKETSRWRLYERPPSERSSPARRLLIGDFVRREAVHQ